MIIGDGPYTMADIRAAINTLDDKIAGLQRQVLELQIALVKVASKIPGDAER